MSESGKPHFPLEDYSLVKLIGKGSYASVMLVRNSHTGELFAMKALKKRKIREQTQELHTLTERNVLRQISNPFVVKCVQAFQNAHKLFFVIEYCPGGDVFSLLQRQDRLSEEE